MTITAQFESPRPPKSAKLNDLHESNAKTSKSPLNQLKVHENGDQPFAPEMVSPSCTSPSTSVEAAVSREVLRKLRLALEGTDSDPLPTPRSFTDAISMMKAPYSPASASGPGKGAGEGGGGKMTRGGGLVRGLLNRLRFRGGGGGKSGKDHVKPAQPFPSMDSLANAAADDHHRKRDEPDASKPLLLPPRHRSDAAVEKKQMKEVADAPNASSQPEDEEALRARRRRVGGKKYEEAEAEDNREDDRGGRREAICREIFADITGLIDVRLLAKLTTLPPTSSSSPSSSSPPVKYYYEMLSSYYERNKEEGAEVANLCQGLWGQGYAAAIFALLLHRHLLLHPSSIHISQDVNSSPAVSAEKMTTSHAAHHPLSQWIGGLKAMKTGHNGLLLLDQKPSNNNQHLLIQQQQQQLLQGFIRQVSVLSLGCRQLFHWDVKRGQARFASLFSALAIDLCMGSSFQLLAVLPLAARAELMSAVAGAWPYYCSNSNSNPAANRGSEGGDGYSLKKVEEEEVEGSHWDLKLAVERFPHPSYATIAAEWSKASQANNARSILLPPSSSPFPSPLAPSETPSKSSIGGPKDSKAGPSTNSHKDPEAGPSTALPPGPQSQESSSNQVWRCPPGCGVDFMLAEVSDQLGKIRSEVGLVKYLGSLEGLGGSTFLSSKHLGSITSLRLQSELYALTSQGGPHYPPRSVRAAALSALDKLYPMGRGARRAVQVLFGLFHPTDWFEDLIVGIRQVWIALMARLRGLRGQWTWRRPRATADQVKAT